MAVLPRLARLRLGRVFRTRRQPTRLNSTRLCAYRLHFCFLFLLSSHRLRYFLVRAASRLLASSGPSSPQTLLRHRPDSSLFANRCETQRASAGPEYRERSVHADIRCNLPHSRRAQCRFALALARYLHCMRHMQHARLLCSALPLSLHHSHSEPSTPFPRKCVRVNERQASERRPAS